MNWLFQIATDINLTFCCQGNDHFETDVKYYPSIEKMAQACEFKTAKVVTKMANCKVTTYDPKMLHMTGTQPSLIKWNST